MLSNLLPWASGFRNSGYSKQVNSIAFLFVGKQFRQFYKEETKGFTTSGK
jgi:hypothetical protein